MKESNKRNGLEHVPPVPVWPPPWLNSTIPTHAIPPQGARHEPAASLSAWDLTPEQYELWEERTCIMHFDGHLPWHEAEVAALADILRQANPQATIVNQANQQPLPAPTQGSLFRLRAYGDSPESF